MERKCENCKWFKPYGRKELSMEEFRMFVILAYAHGISIDDYVNYGLCIGGTMVKLVGKDYVCGEFEPKEVI